MYYIFRVFIKKFCWRKTRLLDEKLSRTLNKSRLKAIIGFKPGGGGVASG